MGKYFGTDGIRGKANIGLTAEWAFLVGRYLGYHFAKDGKHKILIGKDTRRSSSMLENALASGIAAQGCDVYLAGYCPTPMVAYLTRTEGFVAGAMISASHNPFYDNGIKIFSANGTKIDPTLEGLIESYIDGEVSLEYCTDDAIGEIYEFKQGLEDYINFLETSFAMDLHGVKLAVDCANGASTTTAKRVLEDLGATVTMMHDTPDGVNINTNCGSTHPEGLQEVMKNGDFDLGLAFDGDADRMILVAPNGELITGDHVLYMSGRYLKEKGLLTNNTVVTTVMANLGLFKALEKDGINVAKTAVGDKYVYEEMLRSNDVVGGEQSGHIIFSEYATTGDGLMTALFVLKIMQDTKLPVLTLCEGLRIYPQLLVNVKVTDKDLAMEDADVKKAIDKVNEDLAGNGRLLVRPSGTEPLVRVMAEAETDEICKQRVYEVVDVVKEKFGI